MLKMEDEVICRSAERCLIWRSVLGGRILALLSIWLLALLVKVLWGPTLLRLEADCLAGDEVDDAV